MSERSYDTRSREQILATGAFAPFRDAPGLPALGLRELRTLDQFFRFAEEHAVTVPAVSDFLAFAGADRSIRRLENLRTAFDRLLPPARQYAKPYATRSEPSAPAAENAITAAGKRCSPILMAPYRDLPSFGVVSLEDLRVLSRFLAFAEARGVTVPTEADYLGFVADVRSSRRLRSLNSALDILLPDNPAVHVVVAAAIARKSPVRPLKAGEISRPPAARRLAVTDLPESWQSLLRKLRLGALPMRQAAPAASVIDGMEDTLREYARVQRDAGAPIMITVEGVRRFEASRAAHAAARENASYHAQGNRPATRHTATMRLRRFGEALGLDPLLLAVLRNHENTLRQQLGTVVPLKFGRLDSLPDLAATWSLAANLLAQSATSVRRQTRLRLLNEAVVLALWTLVPLRLRDGQLMWGRDIRFEAGRYRINIVTSKEEEPLQRALHVVLTPFLDALVLRGMSENWLDELRRRALNDGSPLFRDVDGRQLVASYPSKVWRQHLGTGAHIARTRVHSELGQLGPEGVTAALALNAQRDARTAAAYQSAAVAVASHRRSQDLIDELLAECFEELV